MRSSIRLVFLFCVFLSYGLANQCFGQHSIGVRWTIPDNQTEALTQLDTLKSLGISTIEITALPENRIWEAIDSLDFEVYGQVPIFFPLVNTFSEPDSALVDLLNEYYNGYSEKPSVRAIGLFEFGAVQKAAFDTTLRPLIEPIREHFIGRLYYTTARSAYVPLDDHFDFKILERRVSVEETSLPALSDTVSVAIAAYLYTPAGSMEPYLKPFKDFLEEIPGKEATVFVHSDWLFTMLEKYPGFAETVKLYNSDAEFVFPVPSENIDRGSGHSLIVLLLILVWGLFAVNYHLSPVYRKSLSRYFSSHIFFVEDVMNRHIRSMGPSIIVLIQNVLLAGICTYSLGCTLFSSLGFEAIFHHYPYFLLFGSPAVSLFIIGCLFGLILTLVSVIWLRISNKSISQTRQVLNLYAMPLQINFFIVTVMTALLATGNRPVLLVSLALLFALVHISAFIIAALDTSRYLNKQKFLFYALSIGLYCMIWVGFGIWLLSSIFPRVIQLALSLS